MKKNKEIKELLDDLISLKTAKLLKKIGFKCYVIHNVTEYVKTQKHENPFFRMTKGELEYERRYFANDSEADFSNDYYKMYALPSQAALAKWLRVVHNIHVLPQGGIDERHYCWVSSPFGGWDSNFTTKYEKAYEDGLYYALKLIDKNSK